MSWWTVFGIGCALVAVGGFLWWVADLAVRGASWWDGDKGNS